ncbi:MAG: hypothetical protein M1826_004640 [Phylliscum demangeonii]|nr:MAG: hypothetical protein M1826_004640 [Phylliscum demangeonii]
MRVRVRPRPFSLPPRTSEHILPSPLSNFSHSHARSRSPSPSPAFVATTPSRPAPAPATRPKPASGNVVESPSGDEIEQPSQWSHDEVVAHYRGLIEAVNKDIDVAEAQVAKGMCRRSTLLGISRRKGYRASYQAALDGIQEFDRRLGHVWATSGYRVAPSGCSLDWGLIHVDAEGRAGENELPALPDHLSHFESVQAGDRITTAARIHLGKAVFLFGARSGVVPGVVSEIRSTDQWPELDERRTQDYVPTATDGIFATKDVSGGLVMDKHRAAIGSLFGGPNDSGDAGYVTPIEEVLSDIAARTGHVAELAGASGAADAGVVVMGFAT